MSVAKKKKGEKKKLTTRLDKLAIKRHAGNTSQKIDTLHDIFETKIGVNGSVASRITK